MFIDASAIVAVIVREPDAPALSAKLIAATQIFTSPLAGYEAALGVARSLRIPVAQAQALARIIHRGWAELHEAVLRSVIFGGVEDAGCQSARNWAPDR